MSYTYLLDLYAALDKRLGDISSEQRETTDSEVQRSYLQGRIDCLAAFRSFLQENYHKKLPRRIQHMVDGS